MIKPKCYNKPNSKYLYLKSLLILDNPNPRIGGNTGYAWWTYWPDDKKPPIKKNFTQSKPLDWRENWLCLMDILTGWQETPNQKELHLISQFTISSSELLAKQWQDLSSVVQEEGEKALPHGAVKILESQTVAWEETGVRYSWRFVTFPLPKNGTVVYALSIFLIIINTILRPA